MSARCLALATMTLFAYLGPVLAQVPTASPIPPTPDPAPWPVPPVPVPPWSSRLQCDLLVGLPTGIRGQVRVCGDPATACLVEGFAGAEYIFPTVGVGVRRRIVWWDDGRTTFATNPGVDLYGVYGLFFGFVAVTGDVDLIWNCRLDGGGSFDAGVKLGAGPVLGGDVWGYNHRMGVAPVVSLICGWHF
jgi:hypothetical protein